MWHLQKSSLPSCRLNSLWKRRFFLETEQHIAQYSVFCGLEMLIEHQWTSQNQLLKVSTTNFNRIHLDILLGQCTLLLPINYSPLNQVLYSYRKIYFYYIKSILIICTKFYSFLGSENANKTRVSYKSKKNPKYWKATKNCLVSYQRRYDLFPFKYEQLLLFLLINNK